MSVTILFQQIKTSFKKKKQCLIWFRRNTLYKYFFFNFQKYRFWKLKYHDQKIWQTITRDIRNNWTAVSILLSLISRVYCDLPHSLYFKKKMYMYFLTLEVIIIARMCISNPPGKSWPGGDRVLCKEYGCNFQDTIKLIGRAVTMTS